MGKRNTSVHTPIYPFTHLLVYSVPLTTQRPVSGDSPVRVLVAEDDITSRRLLETTLVRWGFEVVSAVDGQEAWEILQREDAPQLAILDNHEQIHIFLRCHVAVSRGAGEGNHAHERHRCQYSKMWLNLADRIVADLFAFRATKPKDMLAA